MFIMHNVQYTGQIFSGDWNECSIKKLGGSVLYHLRIVHMKFHLKHISLSTSCIKGLRGMKVSGKKAELVARVFCAYENDVQTHQKVLRKLNVSWEMNTRQSLLLMIIVFLTLMCGFKKSRLFEESCHYFLFLISIGFKLHKAAHVRTMSSA